MKQKSSDNFFNGIDFVSVVSTIKDVFSSDGAISILLDYERVLDEADLYAFKNWELGELVQGPNVSRYTVKCVFMYPYKLMPDPTGAKRLSKIGCNIAFAKSKIKVPIEVTSEEDFVQGTRYPKSVEKKVWFIEIEIPKQLMNEIKEGSIDLADQTIDLQDLENAYEDDLDKENTQNNEDQQNEMAPQGMGMDPGLGMGPQI